MRTNCVKIVLRLFGHPAIEREGKNIALALPSKAVALLALLIANRERPVMREWLAQTLWPDASLDGARANLRRHLHLLGQALEPEALLLQRYTAQWNQAAPLDADVVRFEVLAANDPRAAVAEYTGELCVGVAEEAIDDLRRRYRAQYERLLRTLLAEARRSGNADERLRWLQLLEEHDPLDEAVAREIIELRYLRGDRAGAVRDFYALERRLQRQLDVAPTRETLELARRILYGSEDHVPPTNVRAVATSFVGRAAVVDSVAQSLRERRLTSVVGTAGVGKTRLAVQVALRELRRFSDGVWFVDAAGAQTADDVMRAIADTAGVGSVGSYPAQALGDALAGKAIMLLLDNCERAVEPVRETVRALLTRTNVTILAVGRRRLGVDGEAVHELPPLALPPDESLAPDALLRYSAARLFVERASAVAPSFRLTDANADVLARMLRRLDGLPLAIELVASRAHVLTLAGMAKRLADARSLSSSRLRATTLEAAIAWSYDLLAPVEKAVMRALAVFAAPFTLEAAEYVCGGVCDDVPAVVLELVEASLLRAFASGDDVRYGFFETTRAFALAAPGSERSQIEDRYADYYLDLAESYAPHFHSADEMQYFERAAADAAHFEAALEWSVRHDASRAVRFVRALWRYWVFRKQSARFAALARELLSRELEDAPRAHLLLAAGMLAKDCGDAEIALGLLAQAREGFRRARDGSGEIAALSGYAVVVFHHRERAASRPYFEELLELQSRAGDRLGAAHTTLNLAACATTDFDLERALALLEDGLSLYRELGYRRGEGYAFRSKALVYDLLGRHRDAVEAARASVAVFEEVGDLTQLAHALTTLANGLSERGEFDAALDAGKRSLAILDERFDPPFSMYAHFAVAVALKGLRRHGEAARHYDLARQLQSRYHLSVGSGYEEYLQEQMRDVGVAP